MGLKGQRNRVSETSLGRKKEPNLLSSVEQIYRELEEKKLIPTGTITDLDAVIKTLFEDIEIKYETMEPHISGSIRHEEKQGKSIWIISINKEHHKNRQRFTLAHELGHYILHKDKNINKVDTTFFRNENLDPLEYMANEFAAALLMPEDRLRELIDKENKTNIENLAEIFEVSPAAMKYRVISLGYKLKQQ